MQDGGVDVRDAFAGWSEADRAALARLTGRFARDVARLIEER